MTLRIYEACCLFDLTCPYNRHADRTQSINSLYMVHLIIVIITPIVAVDLITVLHFTTLMLNDPNRRYQMDTHRVIIFSWTLQIGNHYRNKILDTCK